MVDRRWILLAGYVAVGLGVTRAAHSTDNLTFVSLPPCRVIDTRVAGAGGPLVAGTPRSFVFRGPTINYQNPAPFPNQGGSTTGCGIPDLTLDSPPNLRNIVKAVAINIVAVGPAGAGDLRAWAANQSLPNASVINYAAVSGLNIANGVIVPMCNQVSATPCTSGDITFLADVSGAHLVVDVVGYFESQAATVFSQFGGDGSSGALHVTSSTTRSAARQQYTSLTVDAGTTLTMARPFTFVGVQGTCTIAGTISVDGKGASGGAGAVATTVGFDGSPGMDGTLRNASALQLLSCAAGAGGGGGVSGSQNGGPGGGAGGPGGASAGPGGGLDFNGVTAGASGHGIGDTQTSSFPSLLLCAGGGGGGGGAELGQTGGSGGAGGGVLYLECGALNCTGALTAKGLPGATGSLAGNNGGGGGGGVILVRTRQLISESCLASIDVSGGTGTGTGGTGGGGFYDIVVVP